MGATPTTDSGGTVKALYYGDNLQVLRDNIADESIDLIYLDPPFNSQANYNVLFRGPKGNESQAQIEAFEDTWHWTDEAEKAFDEVMISGNAAAAEMLRAMRAFLSENDMMAYLTMMAIRLIELHRALKSTGSLYLHCDPTASHYLKIVLDAIFGPKSFQGEVIWRRTAAHVSGKRWPRLHDVILNYAKNMDEVVFHPPRVPPDPGWVEREYRFEDERGRYMVDNLTGAGTTAGPSGQPWRGVDPAKIGAGRHWRYHPDTLEKLDAEGRIYWPKRGRYPKLKQYLHESAGTAVGDLWNDIQVIGRTSGERLGYPTQKPSRLLQRIIEASSNEGDIVLDPFCGCGTTIHAAEILNRDWIGIDITHLAISLIEKRLNDAFPGIKYEIHGAPKDIGGAAALAARDKYQFQWWATSLVNAIPYGGQKKGADSGIDGLIYFKPEGKKTEKAIVSIKGGQSVNVGMIRDLGHVVEREDAKIGLFITLVPPTGPMVKEAVKAGYYETEYGKYPRLQILTIEELFEGKKPDIPLVDLGAFRQAAKEDDSAKKQGQLL